MTPSGYDLGSTGPGGGKVFYVSTSAFTSTGSACEDACHYMEAQTADVALSKWCQNTKGLLTGTFGTAVGTGYGNTANMVSQCGLGAGNSARASTTTVNDVTFSDWHLPSKDELAYLYAQRGRVGAFSGDFKPYWSSSQVNATQAVNQHFDPNTQGKNYEKFRVYRVRAVRVF
jgi:hypothetical protein